MQEVWRPVVGWEGLYSVSDWGRVRSEARLDSIGRPRKGRVLKQCYDSDGYPIVGLCRNGTALTQKVHCLVAAAFIGPRPEGLQVLHGSKSRTDNRACNLSYGTPKQNTADRLRDGTHAIGAQNGNAKLTEADVRDIRARLATGESQQSIANTFGVVQVTISEIKRGKKWAHVA
jgi:hypothetical protein